PLFGMNLRATPLLQQRAIPASTRDNSVAKNAASLVNTCLRWPIHVTLELLVTSGSSALNCIHRSLVAVWKGANHESRLNQGAQCSATPWTRARAILFHGRYGDQAAGGQSHLRQADWTSEKVDRSFGSLSWERTRRQTRCGCWQQAKQFISCDRR